MIEILNNSLEETIGILNSLSDSHIKNDIIICSVRYGWVYKKWKENNVYR